MNTIPVVAIFDFGKTNKKLFLFNEDYKILFEKTVQLEEITDEDGYPCEDIDMLKSYIFDSFKEVSGWDEFNIRAINFSTYGSSLAYIGENGKTIGPLYNYLKPYPQELKEKFYMQNGGRTFFSLQTASPSLGSLNAGMQLYRIKYENPEFFKQIKYALHLPQYLSYLITGIPCTDITCIGCHTHLWDFTKQQYHSWLKSESILEKLAPLLPTTNAVSVPLSGKYYNVGIGIHDSSAALIPYLVNYPEPFLLLSTGTWNISMNPFEHQPLTIDELESDCLYYMQYQGKPVKASRLFAGFYHEQQVKRIADHFNQHAKAYSSIHFNGELVDKLQRNGNFIASCNKGISLKEPDFARRDLDDFSTGNEAYHQLIIDLIYQQSFSTQLILKGETTKRIFVDGGFSNNAVFMNLLAKAFPQVSVSAANVAQATALGAALAIHSSWNKKPIPDNLVELTPITKQKTSLNL